MPQTISSSILDKKLHPDNSFDHLASDQPVTLALADLVSRIQIWRKHKIFKTQAMPDELKFSIAKLLISGLHSSSTLAEQLSISYSQIANINYYWL